MVSLHLYISVTWICEYLENTVKFTITNYHGLTLSDIFRTNQEQNTVKFVIIRLGMIRYTLTQHE